MEKVFALFKESFIANCQIDEEPVTEEEERTLGELDEEEMIENLKELVSELLKFKRGHKSSDVENLIQTNEQFEQMLQKLESEVRNHISVEHQLKLHIDSTQSKLEEVEKDYKAAQSKLKSRKALKPNQNTENLKQIKLELEAKNQKFIEESKTKDLKIEKLEREVRMLRSQNKKPSNNVEFLRKKLEEKSTKLNYIHKSIQAKREMNKTGKDPELKQNRPTSRAHIRSYSDYTKANQKRAPSR